MLSLKKKILLSCMVAKLGLATHAQRYLGVATGNWSGLNSLYLNPASIADNREKLVIDLFGINAVVDNDLGKINNSAIKKFINGNEVDVNNVFSYSDKSTFSMLAPSVEVRGPGIMVALGRRQSIALTTRLRGVNQFNHFDHNLYRTVTDSTYVTNGNLDLTAQNFNWTAHLWAEAALSYGAVLLEQGRSELKVGVSLRYLGGIGYLGLKGRNMDIHFVSGQDSLYARNTDIEYASNVVNSGSALSNGLSNNNIFDRFFSAKSGNGFGADAGIIYDYLENSDWGYYDMDGKTHIPDPSVNRYKLRLSASVTDLGYINYNGDDNYAVNVRGNGYLTGSGIINNVKDFNDFSAYARKQGFSADTGHATSRLYMPATLLVGLDYHLSQHTPILRHMYLNLMYMTNLADRQNYGNSYYDRISVTPRFDTKLFSIAVPVSYSMLANDVKAGLGVRVSGFYIGSDDMLLLLDGKQAGVNIYAGAFVPLYKHKPRDRDGDHVSNRRDRCPDDMGTWENHGCPEKDMKDDDDRLKQENNATDSSKDCPNAAGLEPQIDSKDTDGDGIPDSEDACPTVAGIAANHGCPEKHPVKKDAANLNTATLVWTQQQQTIEPADAATLDRFATLLKEYPAKKLNISACYHGKSKAKASYHNAVMVKKYLADKGVDASRIIVKRAPSTTALAGNDAGRWLQLDLK